MIWRKWSARYLYLFIGGVIAGLIGIQMYWINNSIKLQNATLERNLKEDLYKIVKDVEEESYCFTLNSKALVKHGEGIYIIKQKRENGKFIGPDKGGYIDTLNLYNVFYGAKDTFFMNDKNLVLDESPAATLDMSLKFKFVGFNPAVKSPDTSSYDISNLSKENFKDVLADKFKIDEVIDVQLMDSLIKRSLVNNGLDTMYKAGIHREGNEKYEYLFPGTQPKDLANSNVKASFLNANRFNKPYELILFVPGSFKSIMASMSVMMISSIIIIIFLVVSYAYFVRTILKQKKLSEMKNTFINNITHEFRTPITNINLAIENWRETTNRNPGFYLDIIEEESMHMERNVQQILQIAMIDYPLVNNEVEKVNINELINEAIMCFEIQLMTTGGRVECRFNEDEPIVYGDYDQLKNMLQNLIDNAIKYKNGPPHINISTYNMKGSFVIQVDDNGIGMSADVQKYIFNRFYRGHTGDRHDVKGFGLGLSYVKYIVDAHRGEIHVKSKPGKGTQFTIYLPKNNDAK